MATSSRDGRRYDTDLTDEQWALVEPLLPPPSKDGPKPKPERRDVVDAILYVVRSGDGTVQRVHDRLRDALAEGRMTRSQTRTEYPTSESDTTYGSLADAVSPETEPDLVAAVGDNGEEGYVKASDIAPLIPLNPEDAVRAQGSAEFRKSMIVPLYEADGSTVIGTFTLTPPADSAAAATHR